MLLSLRNILTLINEDDEIYEKKKILNDDGESTCEECGEGICECDDEEEIEEQSTTASMAGVNLPLYFTNEE